MNPRKLVIVRLLFSLIPISHGFSFKSALLRWAGAKIGKDVRIYSNAKIFGNGDLKIGDNTFIGHEVALFSAAPAKIVIGSRVDIAPQVYIGTGSHWIDWNDSRVAGTGTNQDVIIEDECWICARSILLPGVTVGRHSVIAAGAVVNHSIPARVVAGGCPVKVIKRGDDKPDLG